MKSYRATSSQPWASWHELQHGHIWKYIYIYIHETSKLNNLLETYDGIVNLTTWLCTILHVDSSILQTIEMMYHRKIKFSTGRFIIEI